MARRKSTVVLPGAATSVLRRSARLISLQNRDGQGKSGKDLVFSSEPPSKIRRKLLEVQVNLFGDLIEGSSSKKSPGSNSSIDGFPSLRRSLRISRRECSDAKKEMPFMKPGSTSSSRMKSTNVSTSSSRMKSTNVSTSSSRMKSTNVSSSCILRRSPRFSSGGGSVDQSSSNGRSSSGNSVLTRCSTKSISSERGIGGDGVKSRDRSRSHGVKSRDRSRSRLCPKTKQIFRGCDEEKDEEVSVCLGESKRMRTAKPHEEENVVPIADKGKSIEREEAEGLKSKKKLDKGWTEELEEKEEEVTVCLSESKRMRTAKPNQDEDMLPDADKGKSIEMGEEAGLKTKKKVEKGWTEELELALQGAYLTVKPSPNFWKKVAKMVPGKSAQECFDRVNSALITPRQVQPRRARKTDLSTIPQFALSASKLLKPNSPKTKIRQRRNNLSKKTVRHLLEKQNFMDQGLGFDLFSVLEPNTTRNFISTPMGKGQSLPKILESPMPFSRFASKDPTTGVSPAVLKQVKNKALHEKYIDHLHIREAKRKAESTRLAGKENIRPIDIQKKDSVRTAKDALFFEVQDAIQKLKGLETENSSSSSGFCYDNDKEDESI